MPERKLQIERFARLAPLLHFRKLLDDNQASPDGVQRSPDGNGDPLAHHRWVMRDVIVIGEQQLQCVLAR